MTDINTLMALMSALGGMKRENDGDVAPRGNAMMNILPLVMSMTGGRQAESGNVNGAERRDILPLILNLMKNGTGTPPSENREEKPAPKDTPPRRYAETAFEDIGFAGAEVRSFMETLWRIRKRV